MQSRNPIPSPTSTTPGRPLSSSIPASPFSFGSAPVPSCCSSVPGRTRRRRRGSPLPHGGCRIGTSASFGRSVSLVDYLIINSPSSASALGITGDGRCLFRSVAYGACLRRGKQSPSDSTQKELADELRAKVVEEFVKRRGDTEWFLEGDFETYVGRMRKAHVWGGEPELLMCSHVLRMPITVHMYTKGSDNPRIIAEYGQEYGKDNPVRVLYDGYGHYDALQPSLERSVINRRMRYLSFFSFSRTAA